MKKLFELLPILFLIISCGESPIVGQWERFGDEAEGAVVQVERVGNMYHGKLIKSAGILDLLGFVEKDIKWRDVEPVAPNKWKGKDLIKMVDLSRLRRVKAEGAVLANSTGLIDYWGRKNIAGLLLMPPTRHCFVHLNEAARVKKRAVR